MEDLIEQNPALIYSGFAGSGFNKPLKT